MRQAITERERRMPPPVHGDGSGKMGLVAILDEGEVRQVEMRWGLKPIEPGGKPVSLLRAENRIVERRCLIVATEFMLRRGTGPGDTRLKVTMAGNEPFFCFAGAWVPERHDWPAAFAGLTVEAWPDIAPYQDRHMAIVPREDWQEWLKGERSVQSMLRPMPAGSLIVSGPAPRAMGDLFG